MVGQGEPGPAAAVDLEPHRSLRHRVVTGRSQKRDELLRVEPAARDARNQEVRGHLIVEVLQTVADQPRIERGPLEPTADVLG